LKGVGKRFEIEWEKAWRKIQVSKPSGDHEFSVTYKAVKRRHWDPNSSCKERVTGTRSALPL
jgi:hypothetical protein